MSLAAIAIAAGELAQKPGTTGCISEAGTGGDCQDGRGLAGAAAIVVSPDGENAYVASSDGDGVAVLNRDSATGTLFAIAGVAGCTSITGNAGECKVGRGLDAADDVAVSPDGKSVYVTAPFDDAIAVFARSPATGELNQLAGAGGCVNQTGADGCADGRALDEASSVVVSPNNENVYVASAGASGGIAIFDRDTATGALTQMAGTAGCIDEDGSDGCTNGNAQTLGAQSVEITPDGKAVYAAAGTRNAVTVYDRNVSNGALGQKPGTAGCISEDGSSGACQDGAALLQADSLAISPDGQSVYVASKLSDAIAVFDRNSGNNELTQKAGFAGCVSETGRSDPAVPATAGACQDGAGLDGVTSVAVLPGGEAVYAAARESSALTIFTRSGADGALAQKPGTAGCISEAGGAGCQDGRGLSIANHVFAGADGKHVYAAAAGSSAVSTFDVGTAASPPTEAGPPAGEQPPADAAGGSPSPAASTPAATAPRAGLLSLLKGKGPKAVVRTRTAKATVSFAFSASDPSATFQCKLDTGAFAACRSPAVVKAKVGKHTFTVLAVNGAGRSAPQSFGFTVKKQPKKNR